MHALIIHQSPKLASLRQWAWWWKLSLHLITQYSRVFSSGYGAYSVCVYQYQKFVTDTSPTRLTFSSVRLGAVNRQGLPFFDCVSMIRRYCKHIGAADAYRALLGTDEIHCLRSLILETIVERMYRRSWQLVQQTVALVCQPYVYQYLYVYRHYNIFEAPAVTTPTTHPFFSPLPQFCLC